MEGFTQKMDIAQASEYFDAHPEEMKIEYLNNFHLLSPGSGMRKFNMENTRTREAKQKLYEDFDEAARRVGLDIEELNTISEELSSILQTRPDYRKSIDLSQIGRYEKRLNEFKEMLLPVYREMRSMGYSTSELIK